MANKLTMLGEQAALGTPIEIIEIQVRGAGKSRLLRVYIDKPGGVTHGDCELISQRLGKLLDEEDAVPVDGGGQEEDTPKDRKSPRRLSRPQLFPESYTLEVSSPGVDRKLTRPRDFERVVGQKIRLAVRNAIEGQTRFEGRLTEFAAGTLQLEIAPEHLVRVPLDQIQKANLKFEGTGRLGSVAPGQQSEGAGRLRPVVPGQKSFR